MIANTPPPPYFAVIFSSLKSTDDKGYSEMANLMAELARSQPGFLGMESARNELGITVSYWKDLLSIQSWKQHADHQIAQQMGKNQWYTHYKIRICKVERDYGHAVRF